MTVDDSGGEDKAQNTEAAGGGHVSPHTVCQLDDGAEAHGRQHLQDKCLKCVMIDICRSCIVYTQHMWLYATSVDLEPIDPLQGSSSI